jgi:hypothetical protein
MIVVVVISSASVPACGGAQEPIKFSEPNPEQFPPNTLVASYRLDPAAVEGVTTSDELVVALRQHLMVEAAMPLDEPLYVHVIVNVGSPRASNSYHLQSGRFSFGLAAGAAVSSDLASTVRRSQEAESFSEWNEEEAWNWLVEGLDDALGDSTSIVAAMTGTREKNDAGHVMLRIAAVHSVAYGDEAYALRQSFERDFIEITPRFDIPSSALAGWEPPENLTYDTRLLYLELEATEAQEPPRAGEELTAIELSPEALDRFVGNYEIQPGVIMEVWRDGGVLKAAPRDDKDDMATFTPFSETEFWTDEAPERIVVTFAISDTGAVESMTVEQPGFSMTLRRVQ